MKKKLNTKHFFKLINASKKKKKQTNHFIYVKKICWKISVSFFIALQHFYLGWSICAEKKKLVKVITKVKKKSNF